MNVLAIANSYIDCGWNPVPNAFKTKRPSLGDGWQNAIISETNVHEYFNGGDQNIGVQLGPTSHGLTDIDLDCPEAIAVAPYLLPNEGDVWSGQ
jgi:Bifunctional DNA primase/polymerase, N-terminal